MKFKKYSEIENAYNEKFIRKLKEYGFFNSGIEYVCENKIDGSNLQCSIDENDQFIFGSRNQMFTAYVDFQNCQHVFHNERIEEKLRKLKDMIAERCGLSKSFFVLTVYGELCGGMYRHPDIEKIKGANKIQGRVDYHPDNKWVPFDMVIRHDDGSNIVVFSQDEVVKHCKEVGLDYPLILFRGTLEECLKFPVETVDKTGNVLWGLPIIENNISEGVVIKPNKALWFPNGERVIIKNKGEKFKERINKNKEKKEILPLTEIETKWFNIVEEYITESRFMSVFSKIDTSNFNPKMFGMILGMFLKDMWKDFYKECEKELLDEVSANDDLNFDKVRKEASKKASDFIKPFFIERLSEKV